MNWLLPSALGIAAAAAVTLVALHFIARSRPVAESLPTARFVPVRPVHARTRSLALSDVALLLMRLAAVAVIGLAVAGPTFGHNGRVARIVLADRSRAVANIAEVRDSVRAIARANDVIIPFDSAAGRPSPIDSLAATNARGSLSAALAAATRAGVTAASSADSVEIVLVSPLVREELDAATARIRAAWPGRLRVVSTTAATTTDVAPRVQLRAEPGDALGASLSLMGVTAQQGTVRVVRGEPIRDDSTWAAAAGHALVHWPARDDVRWARRQSIDAVGGVTANGATIVSRFPRLWVLDGPVIARWSDGEPAAVEHVIGGGCIRDVGVLIDQASDLALRVPFRRFAAELLSPCGGARDVTPIESTIRASLAGDGTLAVARTLRDRSTERSRWTPWLLLLGALLLLGELAMRRERRTA